MYESDAIAGLRADFDETFAKSIEITMEDVESVPMHKRLIRAIIGMFSPLL